ncbi:MAG: small subunit ribosomal protein S19e [Candidatus Woesearchaeota archaeon]|jgi:small subunit ribosomal protein S19e
MVTFRDINPTQLISAAAGKLKENDQIKAPEWAPFAKTGVHKERQPEDPQWWFVRCAAILRTVAVLGPIGTNKLRVKYGGRQRRGHKKSRFMPGSGSVARKALQQLEAAGLVKQVIVDNRKGRVITGPGQKLLDTAVKVE